VIRTIAWQIKEKSEELNELKSALVDKLIEQSRNDSWGFDDVDFFDINETSRGEKGLTFEDKEAIYTELTYWDISHDPTTVLVVTLK